MVNNYWDDGLQEDFTNMTNELGRNLLVYPRSNVVDYGGQESSSSGLGTPSYEKVFMQEMDSRHEVVQSGQLDVGDVRFFFTGNSIAEEEGYVFDTPSNLFPLYFPIHFGKITKYKILQLTKVRNMSNNTIMYIRGYGAKIPER